MTEEANRPSKDLATVELGPDEPGAPSVPKRSSWRRWRPLVPLCLIVIVIGALAAAGVKIFRAEFPCGVAFEDASEDVPDWASASGHDRCGYWARFHVGEIEQRMRWVEPGSFMMGSPNDELGRMFHEASLCARVVVAGRR